MPDALVDHGSASPTRTAQASLRDPAIIAEPWAFYAALQAQGGVARDPDTGVWIVADYALIQDVLRDNETFSAQVDRPSLRPGGLPERARAILDSTVVFTPTLVGADPPTHTRLRPLVNAVFSAHKVEALAPGIDAIVQDLLDAIGDGGACDFVRAFAAPLPLTVIADQLGLDRADIWLLKDWSDAFIQILGLMGDDDTLIAAAERQRDAIVFLLAEVERRRAAPNGSLLSDLANSRTEEGGYLRDEELVSILVQLMVAGNETTTNTLSAGLLRLCLTPGLQESVRDGSDRTLRTFVEEVLRAESPVQGHYRRALRDVEIGGAAIQAGEIVHLRYGAANRDPVMFPDPARIDVARANAGQHMAFGGGIHFCVGAMLARKELFIAFRRCLARWDAIALGCPPEALQRVASAQHRGLVELPLRFTLRNQE